MPETAKPAPAPEADLDPDSPRDVIIAADGWERAPFADGEAEALAQTAIEAACAELALGADIGLAALLSDDAGVAQLNRDHRGLDGPTNVLSFPAFAPDDLPDSGHIGDIAVALETVLREAAAAGIPAGHHLAHMLIHGTAHLAGYDHQDDEEADEMEALEARALARLGIPNPYLDGTFEQ